MTAQLDRTAIWVGDSVRYTLRVVHDPAVELVLDNFTKERLPLSPFIVRDIEIKRGEWAGGKRAAEITLVLTSFETGKSELTIPPVQIFYFVRETGPATKESPVETIATSPLKISLGSTLVPESPRPRTAKNMPAPGFAWALTPLALGLAGLGGLALYAGRRTWRKLHPHAAALHLTREAREKILQARSARLRAAVAAAGDDPRAWSGAMAADMRGLVADLYQIPGAALTPQEIETGLAGAGVDATLVAQIKTVLSACDELRYGRPIDDGHVLRKQLSEAVERVMQSPQLLSA